MAPPGLLPGFVCCEGLYFFFFLKKIKNLVPLFHFLSDYYIEGKKILKKYEGARRK